MTHLDEILRIKGKNLFDNVMEDGNIGTDGQDAGTNSSYYRSKNYTEVKPLTTYQFSFNSTIYNGQFYILEYDKDKNFISRTPYNDFIREGGRVGDYTSSANTKFIRFFIYSSSPIPHEVITWVQLEEGSTATTYEPYTGEFKTIGDIWKRAIPTDSTKGATTSIDNTRKCVNLFDRPDGSYSSTDKGSITSSGQVITVNYSWSTAWTIYKLSGTINNRSIASSIAQMKSQSDTDILFKAGKTYVVKLFDSTTEYYDLQISNTSTNTQIRDGVAFTPSEDFTTLWVRTQDDLTAGNHIFKIMMVEGSTAPTAYYPYFSKTQVMPNLKAYGGTVQEIAPDLWGRYVPVEYIESSSTQWIDTNTPASSDSAIELSLTSPSSVTTSSQMFGVGTITPTVGTGNHRFEVYTSNGVWGYGFKGASEKSTTVAYTANTKYDVKLDGVSNTFIVNGNSTDIINPTATFSGNLNIYLFARNDTNRANYGFICKLHNAKIWSNGTLVRNMVPVKDTTNNTYGMFDTVEQKFYGNSGTGSFTAGPEIKRVEYIESSGTQYIDTGIIPTTFDYTITYEGAIKSLSGPACAWGYMGDSGSIPRWLCAGHNGNTYLLNANTTIAIQNADTNNHTFVGKVYEKNSSRYWSSEIDGVVKQNDQTLSSPGIWETNTLSIYLFARHNANGAGNFAPATMKRWICEKNGAVIMHLIPALIGTEYCMLDIVEWKVYKNEGTGSFTGGSEIPNRLLNPYALKGNKGDIKYGYANNMLPPLTEWVTGNNTSWIPVKTSDNHPTFPFTYATGGSAAYTGVPTAVVEVKPSTTYTINSTLDLFIEGAEYATLADITYSSKKLGNFTASRTMPHTFITTANTHYMVLSLGAWGKSADVVAQGTEEVIMQKGSSVVKSIHADGTHKITILGKNLFDGTAEGYRGTWLNGIFTTTGTKYNPTQDLMLGIYLDSTRKSLINMTLVNNRYSASFTYDSANCNRLAIGWIGTQDEYLRIPANFLTDGKTYTISAKLVQMLSTTTEGIITEFMITEGSTAPTEYESYIPPIQTEITDLLYSADDYVDIQVGKRYNAWGVKVLDGVTDGLKFTRVSTLSTFYFSSISQDGMTATMSVSCTHFKNRNVVENGVCYGGNNVITFHHPFATVEEANAWLASEYAKGTPVIMVFPLATPTETTITTTPISLTAKGQKTITAQAEIPVTVQAKALQK